ncbi:MAG: hypothetical protein HYV97_01170 [Bdellovibrio sp.]|nr:hypothetical protein [Bdellovibrio sp.]
MKSVEQIGHESHEMNFRSGGSRSGMRLLTEAFLCKINRDGAFTSPRFLRTAWRRPDRGMAGFLLDSGHRAIKMSG